MAFTHGKNAVFALRDVGGVWRDMTSYVNEVTLPGKAGTAETTVFGRGAKTYIGGLLEGTMTMKGYFDPSSNAVDQVLSGLLGSQAGLGNGTLGGIGLTQVAQVTVQSNYGQFLLLPSGYGSGTNVIAFGDVVLTDYQISAPVTGVVAFSASFELSGARPNTDLQAGGLVATKTAPTSGYPYGLQVQRGLVQDMLSNTAGLGVMSSTAGWLSGAAGAGANTNLRTGNSITAYVQTTYGPVGATAQAVYAALIGSTF